ncbi:LysR family transcriptional regulator [Ramlibacter sp. XY19]|uniref:LysR family transcriptional regulator n=1 Tax=Ramlibacter paludis TaxID=2908000 RepID=UPI0023DCD4D7|nr:LysR family transcriptional regulator [Ramlibacter paludis]MCG2591729.1 LysR family transcriptional regulator [Ramlibacter paludis]
MIRELKTLLAVAREGTFAAAGERVGLTQAAVSAQMQRLEAELGFPLFDRTGRSARLNARGAEVLEQAEELVRLAGAIGTTAGAALPGPALSLGAIASVQRSVLPAALARFHGAHPDARTRIVPGVSSALIDQVDARELEMAVIIRPPFALQRELQWTTLAAEPFRLLVPRAVRGADWRALLVLHPFLRYDRSSYGGRQVDRFLRAQRLDVRDACEIDELDALVALVAQGVGVALVPQMLGSPHWPAGVRAIDLGDCTFHREIGLVHGPQRALGKPARELAAAIAAAYGAATSRRARH